MTMAICLNPHCKTPFCPGCSEAQLAQVRVAEKSAKARAVCALSRAKAQHTYSQPVSVQTREFGVSEVRYELCDIDGAGLRPIAKGIVNKDLTEALGAFLNS